MQGPLGPDSELALSFPSQSKSQGQPRYEGGDTDSSAWWEELLSCIAKGVGAE